MNGKRFFLVLLFVLIVTGSLCINLYNFYKFKSAGPRFTAQDGQELCLRIQILEHYSIGFQRSGLLSTECDYYPKSSKSESEVKKEDEK